MITITIMTALSSSILLKVQKGMISSQNEKL